MLLEDGVPVQVDIIKAPFLLVPDGLDDHLGRPVAGEAHPPYPALPLQPSGCGEAASGPAGMPQLPVRIDAVDRQEIHPVHLQALERIEDGRDKGLRVVLGRDLGLQNETVAGKPWQDAAQLTLRGSVPSSSLEVIDAQPQGFLHHRLQIVLGVSLDRRGIDILP